MPTKTAIGFSRTVADLLADLGDIGPDHIRLEPPPGTATVRDLHVSEQNTEIRLIHAELCLHSLCGQTDLAAYNAPSTLEPYTRVDSLDSVGAIHIIGGKHITQRR